MDPNPYATPRSEALPGAPPNPSPALWNPFAAACWSLLFSPVLGAVLNAINWDALGEPEKASSSRTWAIGLCSATFVVMVLTMTFPDSSEINALARPYFISSLVGWYAASGRFQQQYVTERFGKTYPRRGWVRPLAVAFLLMCVAVLILSMVGFVIESVRGERS